MSKAGLETIFLVDGSPDSPGQLTAITSVPLRVDYQVDHVAVLTGFSVQVTVELVTVLLQLGQDVIFDGGVNQVVGVFRGAVIRWL